MSDVKSAKTIRYPQAELDKIEEHMAVEKGSLIERPMKPSRPMNLMLRTSQGSTEVQDDQGTWIAHSYY